MKYEQFVRFRAAAIALLLIAAVAGIFIGCREASVSPAANTAPIASGTAPQNNNSQVVDNQNSNQPQEQAAGNQAAGNPAPTGDTAAFTDVHRAILKMQKDPLTNGKDDGKTIKWVYKQDGIKAEFRSDKDKGSTTWNRVKIDYNGNKQDDERWDFKPDGSVKRRVSPSDDGNFTEEYTLQGEQWVKK